MSTHTPGPWRESWDYKRISKSSARMIAHAVGPQHSCIGVSIDDSPILQPDHATMERVFTDARLIAAAPDLLAALQALDAILDFEEPCSGFQMIEDGERLGDAMKQAAAAITKARGR